jgi:hypothetical protein
MRRAGLALVVASCAAAAAVAAPAIPDDPIRWRTRLVPEHRDFLGVWVDTRELDPERTIERVTFEVSCQDGGGAPLRSVAFPFTDETRPTLGRGVVYLRYFRHGCPHAHRIVGRALHYRQAGGAGDPPGPPRTATLRSDRIRVPSRQVELIGASPFRTTDPSAYCSPLPAPDARSAPPGE